MNGLTDLGKEYKVYSRSIRKLLEKFLFVCLDISIAYGHYWARKIIQATAVTYTTAVAMPDP